MSKYIYERCSDKTKVAIQHFCKTINENDADIFVFMAQKSLCLYKLLAKLNLVEIKEAYSSTSIDFNSEIVDWSDKKVCLVEDIIISGSALAAAVKRLYQLGVDSTNLEIIALARDSEYQTMKFTREDNNENILQCNIICDDDTCVKLSYEISRLLSYYGIPYDTEYPRYEDTILDSQNRDKLFASPMWELYEITNEDNREGNIKSYTLFPSNIMRNKLWNNLKINLEGFTNLKIRVYVDETKDTAKITAIPMAIFNEIKDNDLLKLFEHFKKNLFHSYSFGNKWTPRSKFRVLQYYVSYKLMELFSHEFNKDFQLDNEWLTIQFGKTSKKLLDILKKTKPAKNDNVIKFAFENIEPNTFSFVANTNKKDLSQFDVNELLLKPFKEHHYNKEIPSREKIRDLNAHFIKDYDKIKKHSERLRKGFSFNALLKIYKEILKSFDCEKLISIFIDRAIDLGIIVPITYHHYDENNNIDNNYICRAYRHGEDLPFGEADKYRIVYFLKWLEEAFYQTGVDEDPATITFEKMIVLFIQMGLKNGEIFNRFLGFKNYPVLKERFCIHGAIATIYTDDNKTKNIYSELETSQWVTSWLLENNLIIRTGEGNRKKHYHINSLEVRDFLDKNKCCNLNITICIDIEIIAKIIATWYSYNQNKKDNFKQDITALTSCRNQYTFISALITELHYFRRYWDGEVKLGFDSILENTWTSTDIFESNKIQQALNSGRDKHEWFIKQKAQKIVNDVEQEFLDKRNGLSTFWKKYNETPAYTMDPCSRFYEKAHEAIGYLYFFSMFYDWLSNGLIFMSNPDETKKIIKSYKEDFEFAATKSKRIDTSIVSIFDRVDNINNITEKVQMLKTNMSQILEYCDILISEIEKIISENDETFSINYESCFIIDIATNDSSEIEKSLYELWNSINEDSNKTHLNIVPFDVKRSNFKRYGIFYKDKIRENAIEESYLFHVFEMLSNIISDRLYTTRTIFIPNIPNAVTLTHNTKEHISKYTHSFSVLFLDKLTKLFSDTDNVAHQILFVYDRESSVLGDQNLFTEIGFEFESKTAHTEIFQTPRIPEILNTQLLWKKDNRFYLSRNNYSTVRILIGPDKPPIGTGILFKLDGCVYCITCQHLFNNYPQNSVFIALNNDDIVLEATILNKRVNGYFPNSQDEVCVLKPHFNSFTRISNSKLFGQNTCIFEKKVRTGDSFKSFGYCNELGEIDNSLQYQGIVGKKYYNLTTQRTRDYNGFSGAAIVNNDEKLLGIHYAHEDEIVYAIPSKCIVDEIKKTEQ